MLYLLAVACPPLAVLLVEGPTRAAGAAGLTCVFYLPGAARAWSAVARHKDEARNAALLHAVSHYDRKSGAVAVSRDAVPLSA